MVMALLGFTFVESGATVDHVPAKDSPVTVASTIDEPTFTATLQTLAATSRGLTLLSRVTNEPLTSMVWIPPDTGNDLTPENRPDTRTQKYTVAVDKVRKRLYILSLSSDSQWYRVTAEFDVELGAERGDKWETGDLKTPEGVYQIVQIIEDNELPPRYGPRAYVLNYPNSRDRDLKKTGYGIWIHGSGLGAGVDPTEGCVEVNDADVLTLGRYVHPETEVFIFPEGYSIPMAEGGAIAASVIDKNELYALIDDRSREGIALTSRSADNT
jgi:L,D-peptidoglycan transpeptidase YkuD (ErfK/YbiS/YcfS/YnhG family)